MKKWFVRIALTAIAVLGITVATNMTHSTTAHADTTKSYSQVYNVAKQQLGKRYSWGSTGPSSFDCSGLTSYVYKKGVSKQIPRTAQAQYNKFKKVSYAHAKKGDLVFFGGSRHSISHVGMYIGNGKMIDAQNRGVIVESVKAPWWHHVGTARVTDLQ